MDMFSVFGTNPENLLSLSADDNDDFNDDEVYYFIIVSVTRSREFCFFELFYAC